jgi:hypothetical protein
LTFFIFLLPFSFFTFYFFLRWSGPFLFFGSFFLNLKSKKNASCFRAATEKAKKRKKKAKKESKNPKEKRKKKKEKNKKQKKNADCGYRGARPSGRWCVEVCASERGVGRRAGGGARI